MQIRRTAAALSCAAAMSVSGVAMAAPAQAAPVQAGNLVAVNVSDVTVALLNDADIRVLNNALNRNRVNVGVVAQIVATVCDVNVGGILGTLRDTGTATCMTDGGPITFTQMA